MSRGVMWHDPEKKKRTGRAVFLLRLCLVQLTHHHPFK